VIEVHTNISSENHSLIRLKMSTVEELYSAAEKLSNAPKDEISNLQFSYEIILSGVKGDSSCKRLASQFISRFFARFPNSASQGLDAVLDLCEDDDVNIRKQAIKDLPTLCRELKSYLPKICDVLTQLLATDDAAEMSVIQTSLMSLFRRDAKGTLVGLFSQIKNGTDVVRERAIKYLHLKLKTEGGQLLNKDSEITLFKEIKGCVMDCSAVEFQLFMSMLNLTSIPKSVSGQAQLLEIASTMADLERPFNAADSEAVDKFVLCANAASEFFSTQNKSTRFVEYISLEVLPQLHCITDPDVRSQVLKTLGEACMNSSEVKQPDIAVNNIYQKLMDYMPLPPEDCLLRSDSIVPPEFEFTKVECLLFAFHTVSKQSTAFLAENPERLKEFRSRLQYFARSVQGYIKKLREFLANTPKMTSSASEDIHVKSTALRCTLNIQVLIRDLFHSPPSYKAKIVVSWTKQKSEYRVEAGRKRHSISFAPDTRKASRRGPSSSSIGGSSIYKPPTGRYSSKFTH